MQSGTQHLIGEMAMAEARAVALTAIKALETAIKALTAERLNQ